MIQLYKYLFQKKINIYINFKNININTRKQYYKKIYNVYSQIYIILSKYIISY